MIVEDEHGELWDLHALDQPDPDPEDYLCEEADRLHLEELHGGGDCTCPEPTEPVGVYVDVPPF